MRPANLFHLAMKQNRSIHNCELWHLRLNSISKMATDSCRIATLELLKKRPQTLIWLHLWEWRITHMCRSWNHGRKVLSIRAEEKNTAELTEIELSYCRLNWNIGKLSQMSALLTPSHESSSIWPFRRKYSLMHSCNKKLQHNTCH